MNEPRGNGRNSNDDRRSSRLHDQGMHEQPRHRDDEDRRYGEDRDRGTGYGTSDQGFGQGQSGYMAGRHAEDRSLGHQGINQRYRDDDRYEQRGHSGSTRGGDATGGGWYGGGGGWYGGEERSQDRWGGSQRGGVDDRWTGRGGEDYSRGYGRGQGQTGGYGGEPAGGRQFGGGFGSERGFGDQGYGVSRGHGSGQLDRGWGSENMNRGYGGEMGRSAGGYGGSSEQRQSHRGKGPKNFQRSDERLRELISEALSDDHDIDASGIEVEVKNGEVTLKGTVDDRRIKRMAEDCVERISGVGDVQNQIKVGSGNKWQATTPGNPSASSQVSTNEAERSKHRA